MGFPPMADNFVKAAHDKAAEINRFQHAEAQGVMMGTLSEDQVSSLIARTMSQIRDNHSSDKKKKEQSLQDLLLQSLMDYIDELDRDIRELEAGFAAEHGDAWREQIALKVFGEDEIPQRRDDESIDDYRKRLKKELIAQMLENDGLIKDRYKNDPNLRQYAEWAQMNYNRDAALGLATALADPHITHPQERQILDRVEEAKNSELNIFTARSVESEAQKDAVLGVDDNNRDSSGLDQLSDSAATFMKPIGQ